MGEMKGKYGLDTYMKSQTRGLLEGRKTQSTTRSKNKGPCMKNEMDISL